MWAHRATMIIACAALAASFPSSARSSSPSGGVTVFFQDRDGWMAAGGEFTTVDFTGLDKFTVLSDQYEDLGLLFPDGNDEIARLEQTFKDGYGVYGGTFGEEGITTVFSQPRFWIAVDYPGCITFNLFWKGEIVYEAKRSYHAGRGIGFLGLVSDEPFDRAVIFDPDGGTFIDNLFFGPPCSADLDGSGEVEISDLLRILVAWGACPPKGECREDLDGSGAVDIGDLLQILTDWGPCE